MIESPLQILREKVADSIENLIDKIKSQVMWLMQIIKKLRKDDFRERI